MRKTINTLRYRRFAALLLVAAVLAACTTPSQHRRMETMLADYEQRNSNYDTLSIDSTQRLADFFLHHGNNHQRMRAFYLLGCAHETAGESPQALDMFYKSLEFADTTSKDCDYKKLSRIHGQIATILLRQHALDDALKEMDCIDRYAQKTNDTLMWLVNKEQSGLIYNMKGDKDSAFIVREFASNMFMKYGMTEQFARSVGPSIAYLLEKGNIKKAKQYIDLYESKSGFFDETDHIVLANKNFYDLKGRYYLCVGKTDSAAYYFRKEIKEAGITNNLETAYKGLSLYYKATNLPDSAAKYALLALEMNDSSYNELSTDYYQRMQAAYNYSNAQQKATKLKTENTNMRYLIICAFALLLISSLILYIVSLTSRKKQETSKRNIQEWREKYKDLQQSKAEITTLKALNDKQFINTIAEKEEQIVFLEQRLSKLQEEKTIRCISDTEEQLINAPIVQLFKESVYNINQQLTLEDWKKLRTHVNSIMPSFLSTLMEKCPQIRDEELDISMLIRLHFTLKEITYLKSISHQNLYSLRKRLLNKVFKKEGTAKEYDLKLLSLT